MKYLNLIWAALWRKRVRTTLTFLSIAVAFLLFGVLHSVTASLGAVVDAMSDSRLRTMSRFSIVEPLPLAYMHQIESVPGVRAVSHYTIFFGYYQEPSNGIGVGAIDVDRFIENYPELFVPKEQEAMRTTRNGALVGADLASEQGWSIGDRIPVTSRRWAQQDGSMDWAFDIVGIVQPTEDNAYPANEMWINYDYFDEARVSGNGTVNMYFEVIDDPAHADGIIAAVDDLFANSASETETMTEKEFVRAQINQIGDIDFFVNAIIGAVLFTLLFVTGNTMMQSIRERIPELAVLKTYGFTDLAIVVLVAVEALVLCGAAAAVGLGVASAVFPGLFASIGAPALPMPLSVIVTGLGIALLLAIVSSASPAWRIRRLSLVDALAGR
jgi:putative ABC transport system permease protein